MNPNANSGSELHLPPPIAESNNLPSASPEAAPGTPENRPAVAEQSPAVAQAAATLVPAMPLPSTQNPVTNDVPLTTDNVVPLSANDSDLIEKEWVNKAKQIIERNGENPYAESQQLTGLKADYMKKRYNKTIKLSE